jgi:hypothetical protein
MMNGHFFPRKSKFVFLNSCMQPASPVFNWFRHRLLQIVPAV